MKQTYGTMYYVADMKESVAFFQKILGIKPTHQSNDWTEFSIGGHNLCLHAKHDGEKHPENGVLIFSTENIKSLFEKMKGDGLNVFGLHEIHPEGWTFQMKDADKNEFSFYGKP